MEWVYRFSVNSRYPNPVEEIDALCTLDDSGEQVFLLLASGKAPPMSVAMPGDVVWLCTAVKPRLILQGSGVVAGPCVRGETPPSVVPLYGHQAGRTFCHLRELKRHTGHPMPEAIVSARDQETFLYGQAVVKRLNTTQQACRWSTTDHTDSANTATDFVFPSVTFKQKSPEFTVVGLDPTAGIWASKMTDGPNEMPSFVLHWDGTSFHPAEEPLKWHLRNLGFWEEVRGSHACLVCIDGPCDTNGPKLLPDLSGWDSGGGNETRLGELALSRGGINLFWTTQNTVTKFDGASRWIARSLILFSGEPKQSKIETHPHGAFTFLWRMFGRNGIPPKKSTDSGRQARLAILQSFIPSLTEQMVPDHDAMDAVCAALVAGLHCLELTTPLGTMNDGGVIWMPDTEKLAGIVVGGNGG